LKSAKKHIILYWICSYSLAHRGQEVQEQVLEEMKQLCQVIQTNGRQQHGIITITFGDLFEVYYTYT
jgi:hypothetical protein